MTYDEVSYEIDFRYAPKVVQTNIGHIDDEYKTIVREDGSLNYNYQSFITGPQQPMADDAAADKIRGNHKESSLPEYDTYGFAHRLKPVFSHHDELVNRTQEFGDYSTPIVDTIEEYEETMFSWTTFAYQNDDGLRADIVRWRMEADETFGKAPSNVGLELDGAASGLPDIIAYELPSNDTIVRDPPTGLPGLPVFQRNLEGGEIREGVFVIILEGEIDSRQIDLDWAENALERTRTYWEEASIFKKEFRIPDDDILDILTACGRTLLQTREVHEGVKEFQGGPTAYRGFWILDGLFYIEAAHFMGHSDVAFDHGLLSLQRRIQPSGAIQSVTDIRDLHHKETGIAIATIVRQCELMGDDDRLAELWPVILRGLDYLEQKHEEASDMGPEYEAHRLFPPAMLDGGALGPFPEYTTPLWVLAGLKHAAQAGKRLDLPESERIQAFYEEIMDGFKTCANRDLRETVDGIPYLPMNMRHRDDFDKPQTATWAFAHAISPGEVFDPDNKYVQHLLELLNSIDDEQGIPKNTGWIHNQGIWTISGPFYAQAWLYAGYPKKAIDYLYAFVNHAGPNGNWREEQALKDTHSSQAWGDMPHSTGASEFIRLVRNLLVFEKDDQLELLPGLPEKWLPSEGSPLVLEETPTRFGPVTLKLTRSDERYHLSFGRSPESREPTDVRIHWDGKVIEVNESHEEINESIYCFDSKKTSIKMTLKT